jgi:hypothetical protein
VTIKPSKSSPALNTKFGRLVSASVLFGAQVVLDESGVLEEASSTVAGMLASEASAVAIGKITGFFRDIALFSLTRLVKAYSQTVAASMNAIEGAAVHFK